MLKDLGKIVKNVAGGAINRTLARLTGAGIATDSRIVQARAKWAGRDSKKDWRVKLTVPSGSKLHPFFFDNNPLLEPLRESGGIFWPLTPSMVIQHSANYNAMDQVHSNYPHCILENSNKNVFWV